MTLYATLSPNLSMERTAAAGRLRFSALEPVHCDPRAISAAVAHLGLVRCEAL
jgi:hypothetical protein